jgi:aspartate/methionine/tyrosine aminotransferase
VGWMVLIGKPGVFDQVKKAIRNMANVLCMPNTIIQAALMDVYNLSDKKKAPIMKEMEERFLTL